MSVRGNNTDLNETDGDVLDITELDKVAGHELGRFSCMAGTLIRDKPWNCKALMKVMNKSWNVRGSLIMSEWSRNIILFKFSEKDERKRILDSQPWHFEGSLFAIKAVEGDEQPSSISIDNAALWVRIYDVPISCLSDKVATVLATKVGTLDKLDSVADTHCHRFLRMKVYVNIMKPLIRGITVRLRGELKWLPIKYESLPIHCFCCGLIGHQLRNCPDYDRNECPDVTDLKYGPALKASPLKRVKVVKEQASNSSSVQRNLFGGDIASDTSTKKDMDKGGKNSANLTTENFNEVAPASYSELISATVEHIALQLEALSIKASQTHNQPQQTIPSYTTNPQVPLIPKPVPTPNPSSFQDYTAPKSPPHDMTPPETNPTQQIKHQPNLSPRPNPNTLKPVTTDTVSQLVIPDKTSQKHYSAKPFLTSTTSRPAEPSHRKPAEMKPTLHPALPQQSAKIQPATESMFPSLIPTEVLQEVVRNSSSSLRDSLDKASERVCSWQKDWDVGV